MTEKSAVRINLFIFSLLISIGAWLAFTFVHLGEFDLILWTLILSFTVYHLPPEMMGLIMGEKFFNPYQRSRRIFSISIAMAFSSSALSSGDWHSSYSMTSFFFWIFHIHHWMWSLWLCLKILGPLCYMAFSTRSAELKIDFYKKKSRTCLESGLVFFTVFALTFLAPSLFLDVRSARLVTGIVSAALFMLFLVLRNPTVRAPYFKRILSVLLGIAMGICAEGLVGFARDFPNSAKFLDLTLVEKYLHLIFK